MPALRAAGAGRVLSIVAGVPIARLEQELGPGVAVVRAMPNTPALVGAGAAAIAAGSAAGDERPGLGRRHPRRGGHGGPGRRAVARRRHRPVRLGAGLRVPGGRGAHRGRACWWGSRARSSAALATQTLLGTARLLSESGEGPEALRAAVTSPGGTTAAGLRALEAAGVRSAFLDAVDAATAALTGARPLSGRRRLLSWPTGPNVPARNSGNGPLPCSPAEKG